MLPSSPAVSRNGSTSASDAASRKHRWYSSTAGMTPAAPFVGAVTTRPSAAFCSFTASAKQLTHARMSSNAGADPRMAASHPASPS